LDWLALREQELGELSEQPELVEDAKLRVVEEISQQARPAPDRVERRFGGLGPWFLGLAIATGSGAVYLVLGALPDMDLARRMAALNEDNLDQIPTLIRDIEKRAQVRPKNSDYLTLLAQYYAGSQEYGKALDAYEKLLQMIPENPEFLASAAQAEFMVSQRNLSPLGVRRAESALAVDPNQRTALGTLGMWAFESGRYAEAISYWERLQKLESPDSPGYTMMEQVLAEARQRLPAEQINPLAGAESAGAPQDSSDVGVGVGVDVINAGELDLPPETPVFIFARGSGSASRMPLAVVKSQLSALAQTIYLTDAESMAGQLISATPAVDVEVQVSPSGMPGRDNASWIGASTNIAPGQSTRVTIKLDSAAEAPAE
jgi:cytochrome c-type biogenesis protein CcmH